jgi:hypothetical protein
MVRSYFFKTCLTGSLGGLAGTRILSSCPPPKNELIEIWQISGEMTLEFVDAMPANDYQFRPSGPNDMYTYGGQMQHIAENNISLFRNYITDRSPPNIELEREDDKTAIRHHVRLSFEYGTEAIEGLSGEEMLEEVNFFARPLPRWHVLFVAQDHTTHHCGQAVVYLNAKGITPPYYRKW